MTNHSFKIMTQQTRPYQGFPYVNRAFTDAPSIPPPPVTDQPGPSAELQPASHAARPAPARVPDNRQTGPQHHELKQAQISTPKALSQAELELRQKYGSSNPASVQSPYVDETIFYDPFENRRIPYPKESPETTQKSKAYTAESIDIDSDYSDTEISTFGDAASNPGNHTPNYSSSASGLHVASQGKFSTGITNGSSPMSPSVGSNNLSSEPSSISALPSSGSYRPNYGSNYLSDTAAGSSTSNAGSTSYMQPNNELQSSGYSTNTTYYTKQASVYGNSPAEQFPTPIPMDQFPKPPPAYSEFDEQRKVTAAPEPAVEPVLPRTEVITTPTAQVTQEPTVLFHPSRKYVVCHHCHQSVLTIVRKQPGFTTHMLAALTCVVGCFPLAIFIYCTDYFKESTHYCPNCDNFLHKDPIVLGRGMGARTDDPGA